MKCGHSILTIGCKTCEALQNKWYEHLISKGFEDIEDLSYDERPLKVWHRNVLSKTTSIEIQITYDYYDKALELLHTFQFNNIIEKTIWELHCEGLSRKQIEFAVRYMSPPYKQSQIRVIIKNLEREIQW